MLASVTETARASVGVIGLGIMGSAMAANLMRAGYRVIGYDVLAKPRSGSPPCRRDGGRELRARSRSRPT